MTTIMMITMMMMIMTMIMNLYLQGIGSVNWDKVDFVVDDEFSVPCTTFQEPANSKSFVHNCPWCIRFSWKDC